MAQTNTHILALIYKHTHTHTLALTHTHTHTQIQFLIREEATEVEGKYCEKRKVFRFVLKDMS